MLLNERIKRDLKVIYRIHDGLLIVSLCTILNEVVSNQKGITNTSEIQGDVCYSGTTVSVSFCGSKAC